MNNIPIYRAKKEDSHEYVIGYLDIEKSWKTKCLSCGSLDTEPYTNYYSEDCKCNNCGKDLGFHSDNWEHGYTGEIQYLIRNNGEYVKVDSTTLAIHFPSMVDNQGTKIFASLSEDGKGGDIAEWEYLKYPQHKTLETDTVTINNGSMAVAHNYSLSDSDVRILKVIGIQE